MFNGMLESSLGCLKEEIRMDIISNNLANSAVIGFKKSRISFQQTLEQIENGDTGIDIKQGIQDPFLLNIRTDMSQGDIRSSGNKLDLAIFGKGFFKINTPEGFRYTRKGNFTLSPQGYLITQDGYLVMGKNGPVRINGDKISFDERGALSIDGIAVDQLELVDFENSENLIHEGSNLFSKISDVTSEKAFPPDSRVKQGYVELSNVNVAEEMVSMIHSLRAFESFQKAMKVLDELNNRAINQVGRLR